MITDISICIASYNTRDLLKSCLTSLLAAAVSDQLSLQIIVVDNASTDDSVAMVRAEFPSVECLALSENIGYGRANNEGLKNATGRYVFILNSDTEVPAGTLRAIVDFMDVRPDVGGVGARLIIPDGSTQISWARQPGLLWVFCEQTFLDRLPFAKQMIFGCTPDSGHDEAREVDQVCGAAFMVRAEVFHGIGGFDPNFFMYYEDTDLCVRIRREGHKNFYLPEARILHHLGASSKSPERRAQMIISYNQSRYYYFNRYHGKLSAWLVKGLVLMGASARLLAWSVIGLVRPRSRSQIKLFKDVLRGTWKMTSSPAK